jgi:long-chain acyl-CoA synthetase
MPILRFRQAMVGDMAGAMVLITELLEISNDDTHISYLPLAHSFERLIISVMYNAGARIGFYRGIGVRAV